MDIIKYKTVVSTVSAQVSCFIYLFIIEHILICFVKLTQNCHKILIPDAVKFYIKSTVTSESTHPKTAGVSSLFDLFGRRALCLGRNMVSIIRKNKGAILITMC